MNRTKRITPPLLAVLALVLWCAATLFAQQAGGLASGVQVRFEGEVGLSPSALVRLERYAVEDGAEALPSVTLWKEAGGQLAYNGAKDRSRSATLTTIFGRGADAYPVSFRNGDYPVRGDVEGCAVDEAVADALWGGTDVLGSVVKLGNRSYYVRGVFAGTAGVVLTQAEEGGTEILPNLSLRFSEGGGRTEAEAWMVRNGLTGGTMLDLPLLGFLLACLAGLPGVLLGAGMLLRLLRRGGLLRTSPVLLLYYLPPALLGAALTLWALGPLPKVPVQLIPSRWSDFEFWSRLTDQLGGELRAWFTVGLGTRDFLFWPAALGCLLLALLAAGMMIPAAERAAAHSEGGVVLGCALALVTVYVCAVLSGPLGGLSVTRSMWLLPPLWLWCDWCLRRHMDFLCPGREDAHEQQTALRGL